MPRCLYVPHRSIPESYEDEDSDDESWTPAQVTSRLGTPDSSDANPPKPRRTSLRLGFLTDAGTQKLLTANRCLCIGLVVEALDEYTNVLTVISPGHPCAFLNRSICYLLLGYPSLAAIDAYRALLAAHWSRSSNTRDRRCQQMLSFSRQTSVATVRDEEWTQEPTCYDYTRSQNMRWLRVGLASLAIETRPVRPRKKGKDGTYPPPDSLPDRLARDVMMKAYYRLAYALWMCGGGALQSALDMIYAARDMPGCTASDKEQLLALENRIFEYIDQTIMQEKSSREARSKKANIQTPVPSDAEWTGIRGLLRTRYTKIKRERYPWDKYSLTNFNAHERAEALDAEISHLVPKCALTILRRPGYVPKLSLAAKEDIAASEHIFTERSIFNVSCYPASNLAMSCDACATCLGITEALAYSADHMAHLLEDVTREPPGLGFDRFQNAEDDLDAPSRRKLPWTSTIPRAESQSPSPTKEPHPVVGGLRLPGSDVRRKRRRARARVSVPGGFQLCPSCRETGFCSLECHSRAVDHHLSMCSMGLEEELCRSTSTDEWGKLPQYRRRILSSLIFLRVLAIVRLKREHPLRMTWAQLLDGDLAEGARLPDQPMVSLAATRDFDDATADIRLLFPEYAELYGVEVDRRFEKSVLGDRRRRRVAKKTAPALIPWSFDANVARPLHCLYTMGGPELALDVRRFDGWVLNTLHAKLEPAIRTSSCPRFTKRYNDDGDVVGECTRAAADYERMAADDDEAPQRDVWVGSVHPFSALVRASGADDAPNVSLLEREGRVSCFAVSDENAYRPSGDADAESSDATAANDVALGVGDRVVSDGDVGLFVAEGDDETEGLPQEKVRSFFDKTVAAERFFDLLKVDDEVATAGMGAPVARTASPLLGEEPPKAGEDATTIEDEEMASDVANDGSAYGSPDATIQTEPEKDDDVEMADSASCIEEQSMSAWRDEE